MKATLKTALELAYGEAEKGRNVMVLAPNMAWVSHTPSTIGGDDSRGSVYIRSTTSHYGLKSVAIDTLILVASRSSTWDAEGEALAREKLMTSIDPRVIQVRVTP
jgi:hypothetical protein